MTRAGFAIALLFVCACIQPAQARTCSNGRSMVPLDVTPQPDQTSPPGQVEILATDLERGPDTKGTLCVSVGSVGFQVSAPEDDLTPPGALGYVVEVVEPDGAWSLFLAFLDPDGAETALLAQDGWVWFNFADDPRDSMDWTFRLAAVDSDGNQGPWSEPVTVSHPGKDVGCATGAGDQAPCGAAALLLLALAWAVRQVRGDK